MKFLVIENGQVLYTVDPSVSPNIPIDQISKDDLLKLIDLCVTSDEFEMEPYDNNLIHNKAHQIIYDNLSQKLDDLLRQRIKFSDEKNYMYSKSIKKYSDEIAEQTEQ